MSISTFKEPRTSSSSTITSNDEGERMSVTCNKQVTMNGKRYLSGMGVI